MREGPVGQMYEYISIKDLDCYHLDRYIVLVDSPVPFRQSLFIDGVKRKNLLLAIGFTVYFFCLYASECELNEYHNLVKYIGIVIPFMH